MEVYHSNRVEILADALCSVLAVPSVGPMEPEIVLVHSRGMERWLSHKISNTLGICGNIQFPFPLKFLPDLVGSTLGGEALGQHQWRTEQLWWTILAVLPEHLTEPELSAIRNYLTDDSVGLKRVQLAQRIARVFDGYLGYRPDLLDEWERGLGEGWQPIVWRSLREKLGAPHLPELVGRFLARLEGDEAVSVQPGPLKLPSRICVFGISTLPPLHLRVLDAISHHVDVRLFLLSPTRQYWADIRSTRELSRLTRHSADLPPEELYFEVGNPLLASLGRVGREFQWLLEDLVNYTEPGVDLYRDPGTDSMLHTLQSDILELHHRRQAQTTDEVDERALPIRRDDRSLSIHSCHSAMRQVEVLQDQLLALFDQHADLEPRDVIVMTPDLDQMAPLVEAVFSREPSDSRFIPFRIADRTRGSENALAEAFLGALELVGSRVTAPDVVDLLALEPIRVRFELTSDDIEQLSSWIADIGVRWGIDGRHRASFDQPDDDTNTWRYGLDRLFLGYAMVGEGRRMFAGALPYDEIEGGSALLLGRLAEFCEVLFSALAAMSEPRPMCEWHGELLQLFDRLVAVDDKNGWQAQQVRDLITQLRERSEAAEIEDPLHIEVIRHLFSDALVERGTEGFLAGGVTFCAMLPMRSIPFRVVCMLGMDERAFPRATQRVGFDLVASDPRVGDRSPRYDDRYLFLEALLSARDHLLIAYTGQGVRDNQPLPPSTAVSELLDAAADSFFFIEDKALPASKRAERVREALVVRHPLQPFSERNFGAVPPMQSYARDFLAGALARCRASEQREPFFPTPLPIDIASSRELSVRELSRFIGGPVQALLERRLGVWFEREPAALSDREPVELDPLQQYKVASPLLERSVAGENLTLAKDSVRASGTIPLGAPGDVEYGRLARRAQLISDRVGDLRSDPEPKPVDIDVTIGSTNISGRIGPIDDGRLLRYQMGRIKAQHLLELWVEHLLLCLDPDLQVTESILIGRPAGGEGVRTVRFGPVDDPAKLLNQLVDLYWTGQSEPILLFPTTSLAYVTQYQKEPDDSARRDAAISAARKEWQPNPRQAGQKDSEDPYVSAVFGDTEPFVDGFKLGAIPSRDDLSFHQVALTVFNPLIVHQMPEQAAPARVRKEAK